MSTGDTRIFNINIHKRPTTKLNTVQTALDYYTKRQVDDKISETLYIIGYTGYTGSTSCEVEYPIIDVEDLPSGIVDIVTITGNVIIDNTYRDKFIYASGSTDNTGYTISIESGLTSGFGIRIINYLESGIITITSPATIIAKNNNNRLINKLDAACIYWVSDNTYMLVGDLSI